jgi:hypothetical protein
MSRNFTTGEGSQIFTTGFDNRLSPINFLKNMGTKGSQASPKNKKRKQKAIILLLFLFDKSFNEIYYYFNIKYFKRKGCFGF